MVLATSCQSECGYCSGLVWIGWDIHTLVVHVKSWKMKRSYHTMYIPLRSSAFQVILTWRKCKTCYVEWRVSVAKETRVPKEKTQHTRYNAYYEYKNAHNIFLHVNWTKEERKRKSEICSYQLSPRPILLNRCTNWNNHGGFSNGHGSMSKDTLFSFSDKMKLLLSSQSESESTRVLLI